MNYYYYNNCISLILISTTDINNLLIIEIIHTITIHTIKKSGNKVIPWKHLSQQNYMKIADAV
jgi:hypothetical protein